MSRTSIALQIDSDGASVPVRLVDAAHASAIAPGLTLPLLLGISTIQRPLSVPGIASAATSNMDVDADNARGALTQIWGAQPPVRASAYLEVDGARIFEGIVSTLTMGASARISLEAGADRPLSDNLPLRTSAVWGGWRDIKVLPWVWGSATLAPIQYSDDQRTFLLADHPIAGVDAVTRDDVPNNAWAWRNALDSTGHAVAFLELATPLSDGERLAVTLRGRMHPQTGRLLQTPAEIAHDLLANLARAPVTWADFDDYRAQTSDWRLGGVLADNTITIRAAMDRLMQSCASAWSAAMPGIALTWPPVPETDAPALPITAATASDVQASTSSTGLVTSLRVLFDWDDAAQRYRRAVQLQATDAVKTWGLLEQEWQAPWLRSPRHAEQLGRRVLAWLARPRWQMQWRMDFADVATGAWVDITHPLAPSQGRHRLLSADLDTTAAQLTCTVEAAVGAPPAIELVQLSAAFDPLIQPGIAVEVANGEIIFTARDEQGNPIPGASVTLDDSITRIANAAGQVSFPVQRGRHTLLIKAQGYTPMQTTVVI